MKDKNTIKTLAATSNNAIDMATIMHTIAQQKTHPTLQLESQQASDRHRHFASGIRIAIEELQDMHTMDAIEMVKHLKWMANKLECLGWDARLEERPMTAAMQFGKANGLRYAAHLLAEENDIDINCDTNLYNEPLPEGGKK